MLYLFIFSSWWSFSFAHTFNNDSRLFKVGTAQRAALLVELTLSMKKSVKAKATQTCKLNWIFWTQIFHSPTHIHTHENPFSIFATNISKRTSKKSTNPISKSIWNFPAVTLNQARRWKNELLGCNKARSRGEKNKTQELKLGEKRK